MKIKTISPYNFNANFACCLSFDISTSLLVSIAFAFLTQNLSWPIQSKSNYYKKRQQLVKASKTIEELKHYDAS